MTGIYKINGHQVKESQFKKSCRDEKTKHLLITNRKSIGNHMFLNKDDLDKFCSKNRTIKKDFIPSKDRLDKALKYNESLSPQAKRKLIKQIIDTSNAANSLLDNITKSAKLDIKDDSHVLEAIVSPRVDPVQFFTGYNFRDQFCSLEGISHINVPSLESKYDQKMSSIRLWSCSLGTILTLYANPCYDSSGDSITFYVSPPPSNPLPDYPGLIPPPPDRMFIPYLSRYGFDNKVRSWWFSK